MSKANVHRRLTLTLTPGADGVTAAVRQHGGAEPLAVARGAAFENALELASLLFPICPRAHQAAALNAAESLAGIAPSPVRTAARDLLVYAEAVVGCIMRHDLVWLRELGRAPVIEDCRAARGASQALAMAVFDGPWARPGGGGVRLDLDAAALAVSVLAETARRVASRAETVLADIPGFSVGTHRGAATASGNAAALSGEPIATAAEETPRTLHAPATPQDRIDCADWFDAQIRHLDWLAGRLPELLEMSGQPAAPVSALVSGPAPGELTGTGFGVAMTARGRLRHALTLENGKVRDWKSLAPTDLNFAENGPVSQLAARLPADDRLRANAAWLVQAFDPCAPCEVSIVAESGHA